MPRRPAVAQSARIRLRPTRAEDLPYVTGAEGDPDNSPYIHRWSVARHRAALLDPATAHRIVRQSATGEPVGFVILRGLGDHSGVELMRLVITRKGRGYGRAAIRAAVAEAVERHGAARVWLDVRPDNLRARGLYESEGFTLVPAHSTADLVVYELPDLAASGAPSPGPAARDHAPR